MISRLADLAVGFGANVQRGQIVAIGAELGKEEIVRALAASAYRRGAKFVDVGWFDPWVKRARIQYAPEDTLDYVPPWLGERILALGDHRAARCSPSASTRAPYQSGTKSSVSSRACSIRARFTHGSNHWTSTKRAPAR